MEINFENYSIDELRTLNNNLVDHIRLRHQRASQKEMNRFQLNDLVCFESSDGGIVEDRIIHF